MLLKILIIAYTILGIYRCQFYHITGISLVYCYKKWHSVRIVVTKSSLSNQYCLYMCNNHHVLAILFKTKDFFVLGNGILVIHMTEEDCVSHNNGNLQEMLYLAYRVIEWKWANVNEFWQQAMYSLTYECTHISHLHSISIAS